MWSLLDRYGSSSWDAQNIQEDGWRSARSEPPGPLLAVLHRHAGVVTYDQDVFINIVGGVRVTETAADLAVCLAVVSSLRNRPLPGGARVLLNSRGPNRRLWFLAEHEVDPFFGWVVEVYGRHCRCDA